MHSTADEKTLRDYMAVVRRRWWVVLTALLITSGAAAAVSATQTPIYEAEAQMLVQTRATDSLFASGLDLRGNDATRAVETEIQVLEGERVQTRLAENLDIVDDPPDVDASVVGSTDVISVRVRSADPQTAQNLANAYVEAYIDERREQGVEDLLAASGQVQNKISELQTQIDELPADDPQRVALLAAQATFAQTLDQLQVDAALKTGGASVVQSAELPTDPVEPTPVLTITLAAMVGLLLGLGAAFAIDYFDDSIRTEPDIDRLTRLPVLAVVPVDKPVNNLPVSVTAPNDFAVEVYRGLRTTVQFLGLDRRVKVIQITSSMAGEGKTTTATNLAVVLAQAGKSVVVVDADLRRPRVHEVFAVDHAPGLTDLLVGEQIETALRPLALSAGREMAIMPSGTMSSNPSEMLAGQRTRDVIAALADRFDHVIIDSAPVLPVADSVALSGAVDAVIFVAQARRSAKRDVVKSIERLERVGAPLIGFVLNQAKAGRSNSYGYGYGYGYGGYGGTGSATVGGQVARQDDAKKRRRRPRKARAQARHAVGRASEQAGAVTADDSTIEIERTDLPTGQR